MKKQTIGIYRIENGYSDKYGEKEANRRLALFRVNAKEKLKAGTFEYAAVQIEEYGQEYILMSYDSIMKKFITKKVWKFWLEENFNLADADYPFELSYEIENDDVRKALVRAEYYLYEASKDRYGTMYDRSHDLVEGAIALLTEFGLGTKAFKNHLLQIIEDSPTLD